MLSTGRLYFLGVLILGPSQFKQTLTQEIGGMDKQSDQGLRAGESDHDRFATALEKVANDCLQIDALRNKVPPAVMRNLKKLYETRNPDILPLLIYGGHDCPHNPAAKTVSDLLANVEIN